jgi:hypothetical protein
MYVLHIINVLLEHKETEIVKNCNTKYNDLQCILELTYHTKIDYSENEEPLQYPPKTMKIIALLVF